MNQNHGNQKACVSSRRTGAARLEEGMENDEVTMNREDARTSARNPITILTVVLVMTWAVLAGLSWSSYRSYRETKTTTERCLRIQELRGVIIHRDHELTMCARSAAGTGDLAWEDRYRRFEPQLDTAIKEAIALAPGAHSGQAAVRPQSAGATQMEGGGLYE